MCLCHAKKWENDDRMIRNKKDYLLISICFLFSVIVLILPYFKDMNLDKISTLIFLNFDNFEKLGLSKLSMKYIAIFIMFFHITFYQRLSIVSENTSYLSMSMHKKGKKKSINDIVLQNIVESIKLYIFIIFWMIIFGLGIYFVRHIEIEWFVLIRLIIYLMKYIYILTMMSCIYQIISIMNNTSYLSLLYYSLFIFSFIIDMTFDFHIITLSNSIIIELTYFIIVTITISLILFLTIYQFINTKEVYND